MRINKPKTDNQDPAYWEKVLQSHNLGKRQLNIEDKPEKGKNEDEDNPILNRSHDDNEALRHTVDGDDIFMSGYQIAKIRTRDRKIPEWTLNDKEVQKVLLRAFPKLHTSPKAAARAGRWARVIHLYFRMQMPDSMVANEMGIKINVLWSILIHIRRVAEGKRADNTKPKKPADDCNQTPSERKVE
jgi:hypothetical protein